MKFILSTLALLFILNTSAQTLTLYGKIDYFDLPDHGLLYYSTNGEKFSNQKYITYNEDGSYSFSIDLADLKNKAITSIVFGVDMTSDPAASNSCVHRVNTGAILQESKFANGQSIRVHTDLLVSSNCELSEYFDAAEDGNEKLAGDYKMQRGDTIWQLNLQSGLYICSATFNPGNEEMMNKMTGRWSYNKDAKKLSVTFFEQWNEKLGIAISQNRSFDFDVKEVKGQLTFRSDTFTLTR